jgi:hypothetical protein
MVRINLLRTTRMHYFYLIKKIKAKLKNNIHYVYIFHIFI